VRNWPGGIGSKIRVFVLRKFCGSCGKGVYISEGVHIKSPQHLILGNNVWIDSGVYINCGSTDALENKTVIVNHKQVKGCFIGSNSHIGLNTIIQAHGGVKIGQDFTCSAGTKIYSLSNDVKKSRRGTMVSQLARYRAGSVIIGKNVWLGLNSIVISSIIEDDVFIHPFVLVNRSIPSNTIVKSNFNYEFHERFNK
jgi:acetyltransferase-like isoleucine patch superfamily enzyme